MKHKMGRFFSTISLCIFTSVLIGSLTSCSSELDQFEDDGWSNEEGPTTLATRSVGEVAMIGMAQIVLIYIPYPMKKANVCCMLLLV